MSTTYDDHDALCIYAALADGGFVIAKGAMGYAALAMKHDALKKVVALRGDRDRDGGDRWWVVGTPPVLRDIAPAFASRPLVALASHGLEDARVSVTCAPYEPSSRLLAGLEPGVVHDCSSQKGTIRVMVGVGDLLRRSAEIARDQGRLVVGTSVATASEVSCFSINSVAVPLLRAAALVVAPLRLVRHANRATEWQRERDSKSERQEWHELA